MNVLRLIPQIVRTKYTFYCYGIMAQAKISFAAAQALRLFTGITSADGYEKLTQHLGPDKRVRLVCVRRHANCHTYYQIIQESALFLVTLGPRLPGE
jgi:hypothetical protein